MKDLVTIDGSMGEGGGQVLRTSLSLSAITGTEIEIRKIRAGREKPGLKRQHLTCVKAVAEICGAKVSEVDVGSTELVQPGFYPAAGGVEKLKVWPYGAGGTDGAGACQDKQPYSLIDLGEFRGGKVVGVVSALPVAIAEAEAGIVGKQLRELGLKSEVRTVEAFGPGNYCYVQLDYERCSVVFSSVGTYGKSRKAVGNEVVKSVRDFLKAGKACEKHLADQLLLPLNLLVGGERRLEQVGAYWEDLVWHPNWSVEVQKETLHYTTNRDVIAEFALHE